MYSRISCRSCSASGAKPSGSCVRALVLARQALRFLFELLEDPVAGNTLAAFELLGAGVHVSVELVASSQQLKRLVEHLTLAGLLSAFQQPLDVPFVLGRNLQMHGVSASQDPSLPTSVT